MPNIRSIEPKEIELGQQIQSLILVVEEALEDFELTDCGDSKDDADLPGWVIHARQVLKETRG